MVKDGYINMEREEGKEMEKLREKECWVGNNFVDDSICEKISYF